MPVLTADGSSQLVYARGQGPGIIANLDLTSPVYVSTLGRAVSADSEQIPALGCIAVDGTRDVFATTAAAGVTAAVQAIPGATSWSPSPAQISAQISALGLMKDTTGQAIHTTLGAPAQDSSVTGVTSAVAAQTTGATIATDISNSGVPLIVKSTILGQGANVALPTNTTVLLVTGAMVTQPVYEISLTVTTAAALAPVVTVAMQWFDSATGLTVALERYSFYAGSASSPHTVVGRGPSRADQVTVTVYDNSATNTATLTSWAMMQNSRPLTADLWASAAYGTFPGFTSPQQTNMGKGWLASINETVAAATTDVILLPLYTGPVSMKLLTSSGTGDARARFNIDSILAGSGDVTYYEQWVGGNGSMYNSEIFMPNIQTLLNLFNNNASSRTLTASIVGEQVP